MERRRNSCGKPRSTALAASNYIVRPEQGRGLRPSPEVLDAPARALRLSADETAYLFDLAEQRRPGPGKPSAVADPAPALLVDELSPRPVMLVNHRYDILAWNPEMAALMLDFDTLPFEQRNTLWLCLVHERMRNFYVERDRVIREGTADLRAAWACHPDDRTLADLVGELTARSPEFAAARAAEM